MSTTLATRLRRIMRACHWAQADLSKVAGAAKQTISGWLKVGHKSHTGPITKTAGG